jgi:hypothetical protein
MRKWPNLRHLTPTLQSRLTKEEMKDEIAKFGKMLGMFDSFFVQVHRVEADLLPTEKYIGMVVQIIEKTRIMWV